MAAKKKLPFDRPKPIDYRRVLKPSGFRLSQDKHPVKFLVPVESRTVFNMCRCFRTKKEAWREAAYWAVENGVDPSPYIEASGGRLTSLRRALTRRAAEGEGR